MPYALNTSHPLYANLVEAIGVDGTTMVSLKTARAFTLDGAVTFGTGTYGKHVRTAGGSYWPERVTFTPSILFDSYQPHTFVTVTNRFLTGTGNERAIFGQINFNTNGSNDFPRIGTLAGTTAGSVSQMVTIVRNGEADYEMYVNATSMGKVTGNPYLFSNANTGIGAIGGDAGQGTAPVDFVWGLVFNKLLSPAEISSLYASLGANNAIGIINVASTPISFSGTVPTFGGTIGTAFSQALASYFAGSATPYTYSVLSGTLPAGITLNASTGVLSGTPSAAVVASGIVIRATDSSAATANTNAFTINISAANSAPTFSGPNIGAQSGTVAVPLSATNVAAKYSDPGDTLTYSAVGTWPAGVTVSSAGSISGTPTAAGTYASLKVRATDTGGATVDSDTFTFTIAAAPPPSTVTLTEPLKNNTGSVLSNQSGVRVSVLQASNLSRVFEVTGLTTDGSGLLQAITGAGIVTGTSYHVAIKLADGSVGISGPVTAS